jgi:hypothetical protein
MSIRKINNRLEAWCKTQPNVHFLNNSALHINHGNTKYTIIGSTLWSNIPKQSTKYIQETMNDYQHIYASDVKKITTDYINKMFKQNYEFIKDQVVKAKRNKSKLIVLTHHKPYLSKMHNLMSFDPAYESDCSDLFGGPVVLWAYGHTHKKDNATIKGTRFVSNPRGYPHERTLFDKSFVIAI